MDASVVVSFLWVLSFGVHNGNFDFSIFVDFLVEIFVIRRMEVVFTIKKTGSLAGSPL